MRRAQKKRRATKTTAHVVWSKDGWVVRIGELKRGVGHPGAARNLFTCLGEKLPWGSLADVSNELKRQGIPRVGVYIAHDSMGCSRYISWRYQVLFVVSAGNHDRAIELDRAHGRLRDLTPVEIQRAVLQAVAADARHRRLLSPAEAVNALTVGAIHADASPAPPPPHLIDPLVGEGLPSLTNAQGMGYRRAIKPEILMAGGRTPVRPALLAESHRFEVWRQFGRPGQRVAAPGSAEGDLDHTWYTRGTSNAAALASRAASELYDVLDELRAEPGGEQLDDVPRAVWLKVLLAHSARWGPGGQALAAALRTEQNSRQFNEYVTRLLGYGGVDPTLVRECARHRVTALGGGLLQEEQAHVHRFPLPPSLSGRRVWRRLVITLAWLSPVNPMHRSWRRADLWFSPPTDGLRVDRREAPWQAVQRGTLQHEVLEGDSAASFVDGDSLDIRVNCRADAGALDDAVPYAVAATLEVAEGIGIDIYDEVRVRVHGARVRVAATPPA